jgi:hypothetical protein
MNMTRMTAVAIGLTLVSVGALRAQTQETKTTTKTKVEMKGGKDVTMVGCLERRDHGACDGTVSVKADTKTEVENGKDIETKSKTEGTTGTLDIPFLGVKSLKTLSSSCL